MGGVLEKAPAFALKREQPYGGFLFNVQIQSFMSKSNEAQTAQVSGGNKAAASYKMIKSGEHTPAVSKETHDTIINLLNERECYYVIGLSPVLWQIDNRYTDYFKGLSKAVQILSAHDKDPHIKSFLSSLPNVSEALAAITEHRMEIVDLAMLLGDLEQANGYYKSH